VGPAGLSARGVSCLTNGTTYYYAVTASDAAGNESAASGEAAATPVAPAIALSARGYKVKGYQRVDLSWSGAGSASVDLYRDGARITATANDGFHTDVINRKGAGTYRYRICEAGTSNLLGRGNRCLLARATDRQGVLCGPEW
jgi:hypothetical protein